MQITNHTPSNCRALRALFLLFVLLSVAGARAADPQAAGTIDRTALAELRAAAQRANSDAVLILHEGRPIADWDFGQERRPIELMSALKSVVGLGVGRLIELGQINSLDQPVHAFYPEWNQGRKRQITIRHLLNHTSGLQDVPNAGAEIYPSPDAIKLALAAELSEDPGSVFRYNNKATNLLAGIIQEAYGQRMDQFFVNEFLRPMGIDQYKWYYDSAGNPHAMAGLELYARDLAKFGQLVLDGGVWEGDRLVSEGYIDQMLSAGQPYYPRYGLLWWRLPTKTRYILDETRLTELGVEGIAEEDLAVLEPLVGREFSSRAERDAALERVFGAGWSDSLAERYHAEDVDSLFRLEHDSFVYYADGYFGQTLLVIPEHGIVAVRQVRGDDEYDAKTDVFQDFKKLVLRIVED